MGSSRPWSLRFAAQRAPRAAAKTPAATATSAATKAATPAKPSAATSRRSPRILVGGSVNARSRPDRSERQDTRPSSSNSLTQLSPVGVELCLVRLLPDQDAGARSR